MVMSIEGCVPFSVHFQKCSTCNGIVSRKAMRIQHTHSYVNVFFLKKKKSVRHVCAPAAFQFNTVLLSLKNSQEADLELKVFFY